MQFIPRVKTYKFSYFAAVPNRMDNGDVAFHRHEKNAVGWRDQKIPERHSSEPDTTDELVIGAVTWHMSAVHLDNSRQQREERRTQV